MPQIHQFLINLFGNRRVNLAALEHRKYRKFNGKYTNCPMLYLEQHNFQAYLMK